MAYVTQSLGQRMAIVATNLISKYGDSQAVFTRSIPGAFDPTTGLTSGSVLMNYTTQGISDAFNQAEMTSSNVQYGDLKYMIYPPADGSIPQVGDTVVLTGVTYRVMNVLNNNLQDTIMYFQLQLRV